VVVLMPPLAMSEAELAALGGIAVEAIRRATAGLEAAAASAAGSVGAARQAGPGGPGGRGAA
jgi:hypothetical protein